MVLAPNWDVLQAVFNELKWFPKQPTIDWLQSHQDDNPDTVLTIPAQLNVHADELATKGLDCLLPKPHVPLDPSVKIQLNFGGGTVTRNIPYFLQEKLLLPPLCQQYEDKLQEMGKEENRLDPQIFHKELIVRCKNAETWW